MPHMEEKEILMANAASSVAEGGGDSDIATYLKAQVGKNWGNARDKLEKRLEKLGAGEEFGLERWEEEE